jgi:hypothetical protein
MTIAARFDSDTLERLAAAGLAAAGTGFLQRMRARLRR